MINLATAKVTWAFNLPLGSELESKALWQGANAAIDPRDKKPFLFQMQARGTGKGDIENMNFHRYGLTEKNGLLNGAKYVDTLIGKSFGHPQTVKTRISAAGNPYHWVGVESYDSNNKTVGTDLCRVLHKRGILDRSAAPRIYTGSGSVSALSCPDWDVVLRRRSGDFETYEWHKETELTKRTAKDKDRPKPYTSITVPVGSTTYQTSAASPIPGNIVRFNGKTEDPSLLTAFSGQWMSQLDLSSLVPMNAGYTSSEEPEIAFWYKDVLYVGARFNSTARRVVAYFSVI